MIHKFIAIGVFSLMVVLVVIPNPSAAALATKSLSKSSSDEFNQGDITDLLSTDDQLSMHLGKKVGTGFYSTDTRLSNFNNVRSIVRGSDSKIHIVWVDWSTAPKAIRYANSSTEGSGWSDFSNVTTSPNVTGSLVKIDGSNQIHVFWSESAVGVNYIKHRVRGLDGNWGSINDVSNSSAQGAVADWQAVPQGDHFGNYYDTVTGQWATVSRASTKTIYDASQSKIYEVPAGKLAVQPRSDGNAGYEAVIEEGRTNYLLNSSFETDGNSDGLSDSWTNNGNTIAVPIYSRVAGIHGTNAQRLQATGVAGDAAKALGPISVMSASGSFGANQVVTFSSYIKGSIPGCVAKLRIYSYNSNGDYLENTSETISITGSWQVFSKSWTPTNVDTSRMRASVEIANFDEGDVIDVTVDASQLEKSAFATSYIPTTTASGARNADMVTVPANGWSSNTGTIFAVAGQPSLETGGSFIVSMYKTGSERLALDVSTAGTYGSIYGRYLGGGGSTAVGKSKLDSNHFVGAVKYAGGGSLNAYLDGSPGTPAGTLSAFDLPTTVSIGSMMSSSTSYNYYGPISRVVAFSGDLSDVEISERSSVYLAGTWEGVMRTPVADWQVISQGDHYGNFYDSITGTMASMTRNSLKTVYDPKTGKIHDVPANYLSIKPKIDGTGYETEIEEGRANLQPGSDFEADDDSNGVGNSFTVSSNGYTEPMNVGLASTAIHGAKAQNWSTTSTSGSGSPYLASTNFLSGFAAGETVNLSSWLKGSLNGCAISLKVWAYDGSTPTPALLGASPTSNFTPSSEFQRFSISYSLPASTVQIKIGYYISSVSPGDAFSLTIDAAQVEKGTFATSYIPTATTTATRAADNVSIPTTGWGHTLGTVISCKTSPIEANRTLMWSSHYGQAATTNSFNLSDHPGGSFRVELYNSNSTLVAANAISYPADTSRCTALSYQSNSNTKLYMNGTISTPLTTGPFYGPQSPLNIGRKSSDRYANTFMSRLTAYSAVLSDSGVTEISDRISGSNQLSDLPNPFVESDGDITIAYNKGGGNGVGHRTYSGGVWSVDEGDIAGGLGNHRNQNIFSSGNDVYYFYTLNSDNKRYLLKKTGNLWGSPFEISNFATTYASEIIDSAGDIWVFAADQSLADKSIKYKKYNSGLWTVLDSEAGRDVDYPQVTMDGNGNIYAFYNIGSEIAYKIRDKNTGQWSSRILFTSTANDGEAYFPNIRYQKNFQNSPDIIDVLYRQSSIGSGNYSLNYGTIGSSNTGTYLSPDSGGNVFETSWLGGWGTNALVANLNLSTNTEVVFDLRTGTGATNTTISWDPDWTTLGTASYVDGTGDREYIIPGSAMPDTSILPIGVSRFIQVKISLKSLDGSSVPTLYDYTLNYLADENDPVWVYPASVPAFIDSTKATVIPHNVWGDQNHYDSLYFDWSGASESAEESGITHYYVYFGTDDTADPLTAGVDKGVLTEGQIDIATPVSGSTYYLRVTVKDEAGNTLDIPSGQSLFTYRFDSARPQPPTNYSVSPVGWATTNNFTFSWQAAIDPGNGASEIKGYEYKRAGGGDNWAYIAAAPSISIPNILSYQDGMNDFYVRSIDNAGNNSGDTTEDWTIIHYYYNGTAPSKPQNVVVSPQQATDNNFTFTWQEPLNHNSAIKGYYYSINAEPTLTNSVYTTALTTGAIPAATEQGFNRFYVVAVDVANDQLIGAVSDPVIFECNTTAPGIPGGLVVSDSSNMAVDDWALTTKWQEPGTGVADHYNVYRSTDGGNYIKIAETGSTGYLDSGLSNTSTYYYKITAVDNANAESAYSSTVTKQPTGKYTEAPIIVSGPEVDAKATNATIVWSTNRESSSFVAYGKDEANLDSKGQLNSVTSHEVNLTGLEPGAMYYYKVQSFDENRDYSTSEAFSNTYSFRTQAAPGIEDVTIGDITLNSAIVSWKTTSSATSKVVFGKGTDLSKNIEDVSGSQVTIHTVRLSELDHSTVYNFKITGVDVDNNQLQSDNYSFSTLVYPRISNVRFEQQKNTSTSTLKVTWSSNVPLTSIAEYQESTGTAPKEVVTSKLTSEHSLLVTGLKDNTDYLMTVKGRDAYGNEALSDSNRVKTDFDTRPPEAVNIISETTLSGYGLDTRAQVVVYWETDEPSTSQVEYDAGVMGDSYSYKTQEDTVLTTSHVVIISDLKPSMSYHLRAISRDGSKNEGKSENISVLTEQAQASVLDMVISTLQNALGWLFGA